MANRAIVYRLYPNHTQEVQLQKTFGCCRFVYNQMLSVQKERYAAGEAHLSKFSANNYCNQQLKQEYPFLREVDKFALTNAIHSLGEGYARFFKHLGRFPKYKNKHRTKKSYTTNFSNRNIEVGTGFVKLPKLGKVKAKVHRKPEENWKLKSATVMQNRDGSYQVSVLFAYEKTVRSVPMTEKNTLGLDYKSDGLYVSSEGKVCGMPHYYRLASEKLAKEQRKLRNMTIGSRNYEKQQKRIARLHRHIANQRKDFLHKQSTAITKQYAYVCVENLNMRAMANRGFGNGKATLDNGYGMFLNMLTYKLYAQGGQLVKVDKFFASSQICRFCGYQNRELKDLSVRRWNCPSCGAIGIDRDFNAAVNIKYEGLRQAAA